MTVVERAGKWDLMDWEGACKEWQRHVLPQAALPNKGQKHLQGSCDPDEV